jgi:enamine deaminase RidA (YjgF/YER057c/UK114 family)
MERHIHDPLDFESQLGFVQAHEVVNATHTLYCSGVAAADDQGRVTAPGDMVAQVQTALENLEKMLVGAGYSLSDVVRLTFFVTDVDAYGKAHRHVQEKLASAGCRYAMSLFEVNRLAYKTMMVEIEATAAR